MHGTLRASNLLSSAMEFLQKFYFTTALETCQYFFPLSKVSPHFFLSTNEIAEFLLQITHINFSFFSYFFWTHQTYLFQSTGHILCTNIKSSRQKSWVWKESNNIGSWSKNILSWKYFEYPKPKYKITCAMQICWYLIY